MTRPKTVLIAALILAVYEKVQKITVPITQLQDLARTAVEAEWPTSGLQHRYLRYTIY